MRSRPARTFAAGAAIAILASLASPPAAAQPHALVTAPIDESRRVTLEGNTRPAANPANDRGIVADGLPIEHMLLLMSRPPEQEQAVEALLVQQQNPQSPNYRHWLSAAELGRRFGPAASDIAAVTGWLASHGFQVNTVYPSGMTIDFSGTAGQVREAFHTEIHRLDVGGFRHIANMSDPQIPAALAPAIAGIASLSDFGSPRRRAPQSTFSSQCKGFSVIGTCYAVVPADIATIYNLNPLFRAGITGKGLTIVAVEDSDVYRTSDWTTFRQRFGLAKYGGTFKQIRPLPASGRNNCLDPGVVTALDADESALDGQWASAAAPGAAIVLAVCKGTNATSGVLIALQNVVNGANTPDVITNSHGNCEARNGAGMNLAMRAVYQQAAAEGISVFASAGDAGAEFCNAKNAPPGTTGIGINGNASTRYNVAVGGTDFSDTLTRAKARYWNPTNQPNGGSAKSYIPEIPWNSSCASTLLAQYVTGSSVTYGAAGFCNSAAGSAYRHVLGGTGGASACAQGKPSIPGTVSGTCRGWKKPSWQAGILGNPDDGVRDTPDVALFAADGVWGHRYVQCDSNPIIGKPCTGPISRWAGYGGTSYAAPIMADIQALVDQKVGGRQGNPAPVYYRLAAEDYARFGAAACNSARGTDGAKGCVFHNITVGDNDEPCAGGPDCFRPSGTYGVLSTSTSVYKPAFTAGPGWNFATGLGSVDAQNLGKRWPR